jgi:hypothetical protein
VLQKERMGEHTGREIATSMVVFALFVSSHRADRRIANHRLFVDRMQSHAWVPNSTGLTAGTYSQNAPHVVEAPTDFSTVPRFTSNSLSNSGSDDT